MSEYLVVEKKQLRNDLAEIVGGFLGTGMYGRLSQLLADYATDGLLAEQAARRRKVKKIWDTSLTVDLLTLFVESCGVQSPPREEVKKYVRRVMSDLSKYERSRTAKRGKTR